MELENNFNIEDFLDMSNDDIMKKNGGKKFDIILMNPPYSNTGGNNIHLDFVEKCLDISEKQIVVMPSGLIKRDSKFYKKYKEKFNKYLYEVEEVDSKIFGDTNMQNISIYLLDHNEHDKLIIKYNNNIEEIEGGILNKDYSGFNKYEKEIVKYLYTNNPNYFIYGPRDKNNLKFWIDKYLSKLPDNKVFMLTNLSNGSNKGPWNPCFISSKLGQILKDKKELEEELYKRNGMICCIMQFNSITSAKNCKIALQNPLLRFTLLKTQTDQNLHKYHYQYIPTNINWEDDRVKTDEGLLEICGCPKDKCKEYADYCKKIIDEVDNK